MSVINFTITDTLEEKINQVIKEFGFSSRAEFFRFLAINFIAQNQISEEKEYERVMQELTELLQKKAKEKKIPSLESQLADLAV